MTALTLRVGSASGTDIGLTLTIYKESENILVVNFHRHMEGFSKVGKEGFSP